MVNYLDLCAPIVRFPNASQPTLTFAIHLHGRLVVLAPFPYLFRSLRQRGSAPASSCSGLSNRGLISYCVSVAEADVRVRVRGRVVSVHRQRGQVRVVRVVAAAEATNRRDSAAAFLSCMSLCHSDCSKNSTSPPAGTPIPACRLTDGMDFLCIEAVAPPPYINPSKRLMGFTDDFRGGRGCAARFRLWPRYARRFSSSRYRAPLFSF